jgi:anti-sigma B factor antagonist
VSNDGGDRRDLQRAAVVTRLGRISLRSARDGVVHTLVLSGELDLVTAADVDEELARIEASDAQSIVVDLSELTFIDSTGVSLIVAADARSHADADRLSLRRGPSAVQRVFEIAGVIRLLPFADWSGSPGRKRVMSDSALLPGSEDITHCAAPM